MKKLFIGICAIALFMPFLAQAAVYKNKLFSVKYPEFTVPIKEGDGIIFRDPEDDSAYAEVHWTKTKLPNTLRWRAHYEDDWLVYSTIRKGYLFVFNSRLNKKQFQTMFNSMTFARQ